MDRRGSGTDLIIFPRDQEIAPHVAPLHLAEALAAGTIASVMPDAAHAFDFVFLYLRIVDRDSEIPASA